MALGATATRVWQQVLGQSLGLIGIGVAVGTMAALGAGRVLTGLVDGAHAIEVSSLLLAITVVIGAGLLASSVPARRASRVDATTALRQE